MATDDVQRLVVGEAPAPAHFKVPGNGQIKPKAIFASFDGSGAGGDFLPALKIISDGGETVAICPTDSTVVAGASADVSWFHGIGAGGGGSAGAAEYALGYTDYLIGPNPQSQAVAANAHAKGYFVNASTTNSAVMSWSTSIHQYDTLTLSKVGVYIMFLGVLWDTITTASNSIILSTSQRDLPHLPFLPNTSPFAFDSSGQTNVQDYTVAHVTLPPVTFSIEHTEVDGINATVDKQWLSVTYLKTT